MSKTPEPAPPGRGRRLAALTFGLGLSVGYANMEALERMFQLSQQQQQQQQSGAAEAAASK